MLCYNNTLIMTELLLDDLRQGYQDVPHTRIPSNEPYGPGEGAPAEERKLAMREFVDGGQDWPDIGYPLLDNPPLDTSERAYTRLLSQIIAREQANGGPTPESELMYEKAARKAAEVYRHMEARRLQDHMAAARALGVVATDRLELSRQRAADMSGELFGEVSPRVFQGMLAQDITIALNALESPDLTRVDIAKGYLRSLGMSTERAREWLASAPEAESFELQDSTIETIREDLLTLFPKLRDFIKQFGGRTTGTRPADAAPAFWAALDAYGLKDKGWKFQLLQNKSAAKYNGSERKITCGEGRADFTPSTIVHTPIHEGGHSLRFQNGREQQDVRRQSALPGSLAFDEGVLTALEQVMSGDKRVPGRRYYMQLGLLQGLHLPAEQRSESDPRQSHRAVREIMWHQDVLKETGPLTDQKRSSLRAKAADSVQRTARGGARDNRDISYMEGARPATAWLNETAKLPASLRRQRLQWVMSGVFDPTNPAHVEIYGGDPAAEYLAGQEA
jgi:hypothetical protein